MAGRVALVTGGNRGIGKAVVRSFAEDGDAVVLGARDPGDGEAARAEMDDLPGEVVVAPLDVTSDGALAAVADLVEQSFGRLDVLVNNAGIDYDTDQRAATADLVRVLRAFEVNTLGPWRVTQALLRMLRASEHPRVVNVSSGSGQLDGMGAGTPGYGVTKAALNALTIKLAADLRDQGILVNAVCPGWVRTEMGGPSASRSPAEGAASVRWAADLDDDGPTGGFFRDGNRLAW